MYKMKMECLYIDENITYVGKYGFNIGSVLFLILSVLRTVVLNNVLYLDYKICIFSEHDLYLYITGLAPLPLHAILICACDIRTADW